MGETGGVIKALFIIPIEVLDMHLLAVDEERGKEISRRLLVRVGMFRNENARELFPAFVVVAVVGCVRRGTADDRSKPRANIAPVRIIPLQMTAIILHRNKLEPYV